jgi:hypothetical protein
MNFAFFAFFVFKNILAVILFAFGLQIIGI